MLERLLVGETGLLEQVDDHVSSGQLTSGVEVNTDELSEPGGVVVPHGLGISPSLKDGVGLDNLVLKGGLALLPLSGGADGGEVRDDLLGVLSLSGTRLSGDKDGLVDHAELHALVGALSHSEDVRPALCPPLTNIQLHGPQGVDGETLVGVDGDTEEAGVGVDELGLVPDHRVPEDASVSKEGEISHVLRHIKLGRVDLADFLGLEGLHLAINIDRDLLANSFPVSHLHLLLGEPLKVATVSLVWNPGAPLAIVRLLAVVDLHLGGDLQPGRRIRVRPGGLLDMAGHPGGLVGLPWDFLWADEASLAILRRPPGRTRIRLPGCRS